MIPSCFQSDLGCPDIETSEELSELETKGQNASGPCIDHIFQFVPSNPFYWSVLSLTSSMCSLDDNDRLAKSSSYL